MKAVLRPGAWALACVAALEIVAADSNLYARHELSEQELAARIASEGNLTKKAKLEIQLGGLKLSEAVAAYDHDHFDAGPKLLDAYRGVMKQAWDLLAQSGRDAGRRPQGFKDLDIALREHARRLNDLRQRTPLADRLNIENVTTEIDALHSQVLTALFPGAQMKESAPPPQIKPPLPSTPALRPGEPRS